MQKITLFKNGVGHDLTLVENVNPKSKNISLRLKFEQDEVHLNLPSRWHRKQGHAFIQSKKLWIQKHFLSFQKPQNFLIKPNQTISIMGEDLRLQHRDGRGIFREGNILYIGGDLIHFESRVKRFVAQHLLVYCEKKVPYDAHQIHEGFNRITIRQTTSRFGSCSSGRNLSFTLALGFMPLWVIDYVIAHEVCHLREMNHSAAFWQLVDAVYEGDVAKAKQYLKEKGNSFLNL